MKHYPHPEGVKLDNLLKMADYIEKVPQEKFNMGNFRSRSYDNNNHECKSYGCIIGHCVVLQNSSQIPFDEFNNIDYVEWCYIFTGINDWSSHWLFLFGPSWRINDNTVVGAAKRIRYYVKNGLPENWYDVYHGYAPLIYNQ